MAEDKLTVADVQRCIAMAKRAPRVEYFGPVLIPRALYEAALAAGYDMSGYKIIPTRPRAV
jgi:hypothetical protein